MTKLLGLKPFYGGTFEDVSRYLSVDLPKAFRDLFGVLGTIKLAEAYVEGGVATFADYTIAGIAEDVAAITLDAGEWSVFGTVQFNANGATGTLTGEAWIGLDSLSTAGTTYGQSYVKTQITATGQYRTAHLFRRVTLAKRSNVYLGSIGNYTAGTMQRLGSIWAIGRK